MLTLCCKAFTSLFICLVRPFNFVCWWFPITISLFVLIECYCSPGTGGSRNCSNETSRLPDLSRFNLYADTSTFCGAEVRGNPPLSVSDPTVLWRNVERGKSWIWSRRVLFHKTVTQSRRNQELGDKQLENYNNGLVVYKSVHYQSPESLCWTTEWLESNLLFLEKNYTLLLMFEWNFQTSTSLWYSIAMMYNFMNSRRSNMRVSCKLKIFSVSDLHHPGNGIPGTYVFALSSLPSVQGTNRGWRCQCVLCS